jgi:hypothetical protein
MVTGLYVRVVAVRCGTLCQSLLVIDLSASNSISRSLVLDYWCRVTEIATLIC